MNTDIRHESETTEKTSSSLILLSIALLVIVYTGQKAWIISRTEVIAKDGTLYLQMAREWASDPEGATERYIKSKGLIPHPGFPLMIKSVHSWFFSGTGGERESWERSGTAVSFTAGLLAVVGIYLLAGMMFRSWTAALVGTLLVGVGKKFTRIGTDVLSDMPALSFEVWSLVVAILACRAIIRKQWIAVAWASLTGLIAATGFLVRPEAAIVLPVAGFTWLIIQLRQKGSWLIFAVSCLALAAVSIAGVAPYMLAAGRISTKIVSAGGVGPVILAYTQYPIDQIAPVRLVAQFFEAQHPVVAILSSIWIVCAPVARTVKKMPLRKCVVFCTETGASIIGFVCLLVSLLVMHHYTKTGAMAHRYLLLPAGVLAGAAGATLVAVCRIIATAVRSKADTEKFSRVLIACLTASLAAALLIHAREPLHEKDIYAKQAGLYLNEIKTEGDVLLTDNSLVRHYGEIHLSRTRLLAKWHLSRWMDQGNPLEEFYRNILKKRRRFTLATFEHENPEVCEAVEKVFREYGFIREQVFVLKDGNRVQRRMLVFRREQK